MERGWQRQGGKGGSRFAKSVCRASPLTVLCCHRLWFPQPGGGFCCVFVSWGLLRRSLCGCVPRVGVRQRVAVALRGKRTAVVLAVVCCSDMAHPGLLSGSQLHLTEGVSTLLWFARFCRQTHLLRFARFGARTQLLRSGNPGQNNNPGQNKTQQLQRLRASQAHLGPLPCLSYIIHWRCSCG